MFRLTTLTPYEGKIESVRLGYDPIRRGQVIGTVTDLDGQKWDMGGFCGGYILLRPYADDFFTSTQTGGWSGLQEASWKPYAYTVEVADVADADRP